MASDFPLYSRPMLQPYDLLMLAVVVGAMFVGVWKGMAWQIAALGFGFVSGAVAVHSSARLAPYFSTHEPWNRFLAMLVLYVATAAGIWLAFRLVARVIDRVQLKEFDRQLGALFGLAKGVLYCVVITFFAVTLSEPGRQTVLQSRSGVLIARGIRDANPILPADVRRWLGKYIDELDEKLHAPPLPPEAPQGAAYPPSYSGQGGGGKTMTGGRKRSVDHVGAAMAGGRPRAKNVGRGRRFSGGFSGQAACAAASRSARSRALGGERKRRSEGSRSGVFPGKFASRDRT